MNRDGKTEHQPYRLLIADDEMIERAVLYKTLSKRLENQCVIFQAQNGREAVRIHEEEGIQIAILDIEMPGINGIEAARQIREKDKECCIIFLTAFDEFNYARKAITVRALDYLLKPYDEQELMLVLEEAMHLVEEYRNRQMETSSLQTEASQAETSPDEREVPEAQPEETEGSEDYEEPRLLPVMNLIESVVEGHYMKEFSMQDAARMLNYSEAYFCKLFKQCFGKNFTSYLTEYRIEKAKKLLGQSVVNVKEVGCSVGYGDANYFAKVFKRITGQSPSEYRQECLSVLYKEKPAKG